MTNFYRMTIRQDQNAFSVFKLKPGQTGSVTDMAQCKRFWYVSPLFAPKFTGSYEQCTKFIEQCGAQFQPEN